MSVKVLKPGVLATIQDLGRFGSQKYGVIVGGAMDSLAVRIANILVGNAEGEATIEVTMYGTKLQFEDEHLIAITGGDLEPKIDGEPLSMWRPALVRKGQVLTFNSPTSGCRAYIAFSGGLQVPKVMGSKSTYTQANIGGYKGRELQKDDVLYCGEVSEQGESFIRQLKKLNTPVPWSVNYSPFYFYQPEKIRILKGSEFDWFEHESQHNLVSEPYKITLHTNRMGCQLEGEKLSLMNKSELLSEGVTYGTIQVPTNGLPIILMAERQTTGGYPKIGQVVTADLPRLAQMQPGHTIYFEIISIDEAEKLLIQQERDIHEFKMGVHFKASGVRRK